MKLSSFLTKTKHRHLSGQVVSACQLSAWKYINSSRSRKKHLTRGVALSSCIRAHHWPFVAKPIAPEGDAALPLQVVVTAVRTRPHSVPFAGSFAAPAHWISGFWCRWYGIVPAQTCHKPRLPRQRRHALPRPSQQNWDLPVVLGDFWPSVWSFSTFTANRLCTVCSWMVRYLGNSYTEDWS